MKSKDPQGKQLAQDEMMIQENVNDLQKEQVSIQKGRIEIGELSLYSTEKKWNNLLVIISVLLLTSIPSILVTLDRWFYVLEIVNYPRVFLCSIDLFCLDGMPGYFIWVPVFLLLSTIVFFVFRDSFNPIVNSSFLNGSISKDDFHIRRNKLLLLAILFLLIEIFISITFNRVPGAELLVIIILFYFSLSEKKDGWIRNGINSLREQLIKNYYIMISIFLGLIAIVLFFQNYYRTFGHVNWIYVLLLFFVFLLIRKKITTQQPLFWISILVIIIYTFQMDSWFFTKIGDEYSFFYFARDISNRSIPWLYSHIFDIKGVYETHSILSSIITYLLMNLTGFDHFSWLLSNFILILLSIVFFYLFFKMFFDRSIALISVFLLSGSSYLIGFSKIGYNNLQALFFGSFLMWVSGKSISNKSISKSFLVGISTGAMLYSFQAAFFYIPVVLVMLLIFDPPKSKKALRRYLFTFSGFLIMFLPLLFQPEFLSILKQGSFYNQVIVQSNETILFHIWSNFIYSLFSYLYLFNESHFVVSSMIDPLTAVFFGFGLLLSFRFIFKRRTLLFIVSAYFIQIILVGIIHDYPTPPITRLFITLPWIFCIASIGLSYLLKLIGNVTKNPPVTYKYALVSSLIIVLLLNFYQSSFLTFKRYAYYYFEPVVFRVMQHNTRITFDQLENFQEYLVITDYQYNLHWMFMLQDVYYVPESKAQLNHLSIDSQEIPSEWIKRIIEDDNLIIFALTSLPEDLLSYLRGIMKDNGKNSCELRYRTGSPVMAIMWNSQKYDYICEDLFGFH